MNMDPIHWITHSTKDQNRVPRTDWVADTQSCWLHAPPHTDLFCYVLFTFCNVFAWAPSSASHHSWKWAIWSAIQKCDGNYNSSNIRKEEETVCRGTGISWRTWTPFPAIPLFYNASACFSCIHLSRTVAIWRGFSSDACKNPMKNCCWFQCSALGHLRFGTTLGEGEWHHCSVDISRQKREDRKHHNLSPTSLTSCQSRYLAPCVSDCVFLSVCDSFIDLSP